MRFNKSQEALMSLSRSIPRLPALSNSPKGSQTEIIITTKPARNTPRMKSDGESSQIPHIENTAVSKKRCGYVYRYAANTHQGLIRVSNEDRLSIIMNIPCPVTFSPEKWPHSSFYGIYDGHGGKSCANFLKENLHKYIFNSSFFPSQPKKALIEGFQEADKAFLSLARDRDDNSGSCATVVMVIGDKCYVANTGDSRAVLSSHKGEKITRLTKDHKPNEPSEYNRIISLGGTIVTHSYPVLNSHGERIGENCSRVVPGNLAVSRTFGDFEVKTSGIVIVDPDVRSFRMTEEFDFVVIASDGIFDKISDRECVEIVWKSFKRRKELQKKIRGGVEDIMKNSFYRQTMDNVSVVLVVFKGIKECLEEGLLQERNE